VSNYNAEVDEHPLLNLSLPRADSESPSFFVTIGSVRGDCRMISQPLRRGVSN
jgi:hypothetical protein